MRKSLAFPFLVVITTTPLAARDPQMAAAAASFSTVILSTISIFSGSSSTSKSSTIKSGLLPELRDAPPRIRYSLLYTVKPGTAPSNIPCKELLLRNSISLLLIVFTAPVTLYFFIT